MNTTRVRGLIRLFRFELPFSAGTCVVLGMFLALGSIPPLDKLVLGFLSFFFISATALILNDYFDIEIDRINAPHRPLPSGMVTKQDVLILSIVVAGLGFLASMLISLQAFAATFLVWGIGVLYNWRFKRSGLLGNLMVSVSVGMTFIFGGIVVGQPADINVLWFGAIAMLLDLGEEIAADAMDAEGDAVVGSRSVAILYGRDRALQVSAGIFGMLILVSLAPFLLGTVSLIYLIPIALMDLVIAYSTVRLLDPNTRNPRGFIRLIYLSGLGAMLLFIALRLFE